MATINIDNIHETQAVGNQEAADVKGGAWYAKFDGVDGSVTESKSTPKLMLACATGQHI